MKRILAIDGGGIRGIIPAKFCEQLEKYANSNLGDLFDLIVGTSTGGIIALALSRPSLGSIKKVVELYTNKGNEIFSNPKSFLSIFFKPKYNAIALENAMKDYFSNTKLGEADTKVMVTYYDMFLNKPKTLRSWSEDDKNFLMRDAARATSAAPIYFPPASLDSKPAVDGGVFANNPSALAYAEAKQLWPLDELLLVSIGTGEVIPEAIDYQKMINWGLKKWALPLIKTVFSGTSATTDEIMKQLLARNRYYRFQATIKDRNAAMDDITKYGITQLIADGENLAISSKNKIEDLMILLKDKKFPKPTSNSPVLWLFSKQQRFGDPQKVEVIKNAISDTSSNEISSLQELDDVSLDEWKGIFLTLPYGQKFERYLIDRLVKWVRNGGHLVATGYELGERHHKTNINQLLYHFGILFNSDVVVKPDSPDDKGDKGYNQLLEYNKVNNTYPALTGIDRVFARNACSLKLEPGSISLFSVTPNKIREPEPNEVSYDPESFEMTIPDPIYGKAYEDKSCSLMAIAPKDLTGKGEVLVIGTWDFRPTILDPGPSKNIDSISEEIIRKSNDAFIRNIWKWLCQL